MSVSVLYFLFTYVNEKFGGILDCVTYINAVLPWLSLAFTSVSHALVFACTKFGAPYQYRSCLIPGITVSLRFLKAYLFTLRGLATRTYERCRAIDVPHIRILHSFHQLTQEVGMAIYNQYIAVDKIYPEAFYIGKAAVAAAAGGGHLDIVKWLVDGEPGCKWDHKAMQLAARGTSRCDEVVVWEPHQSVESYQWSAVSGGAALLLHPWCLHVASRVSRLQDFPCCVCKTPWGIHDNNTPPEGGGGVSVTS